MFKVLSARTRRPTPSGSKEEPTFKKVMDRDGKISLVRAGMTNVYDKIQASKDSVDIEKIVKRASITGDVSLLEKYQGFFGDFTLMPQTLPEMFNRSSQFEELWNKTPKEVKELFDNDINKFSIEFGTPEFMEKVFPPKENAINRQFVVEKVGESIE